MSAAAWRCCPCNVRPGADKGQDAEEDALQLTEQLAVAVNPESGDRRGEAILAWLRHRHPRIVCIDLSAPVARNPTEIARLGRLGRLVVAGGDGSIAVALRQVERLIGRGSVPAISVLPLGVCNEVARCLGWQRLVKHSPRPRSPRAPCPPLQEYLAQVCSNGTVPIDVWRVVEEVCHTGAASSAGQQAQKGQQALQAEQPGEQHASTTSSTERSMLCNLAIGFDAEMSRDFDALRVDRPWIGGSNLANKAVFGWLSLKHMVVGDLTVLACHIVASAPIRLSRQRAVHRVTACLHHPFAMVSWPTGCETRP